jgi:hypothetical protein
MMKEGGQPIELGLRLKVRNGQITEMEHLIAGNLREPFLVNGRSHTRPARDGPARGTR